MLRRLAGKLAFLAPLWRRFGTACGPLWRQNGALAPFWPRFCTALAQNLHCFVIVLPAAENLNACAADVCARARARAREHVPARTRARRLLLLASPFF